MNKRRKATIIKVLESASVRIQTAPKTAAWMLTHPESLHDEAKVRDVAIQYSEPWIGQPFIVVDVEYE